MTEPNVIDNAGAVACGNIIGGDLRQNVTVYTIPVVVDQRSTVR
ncbi:hypothetical protein [Actinoallomurus sp. CA-150999]